MFISKNNFFLFFLLLFLIFFSTLTWDLISIPNTNNEIIGEYFFKKHHSLNDPLRYLYFILCPTAGYFLFKFFFEKKSLYLEIFKFKTSDNNITNSKIFLLFVAVIFILLLQFCSITLQINKIDLFHEGQKLSAAFKSFKDDSLWSGSFYTTGIILENLGIKLLWKILDYQSIGAMRYLEYLYILFFKLSLVFLIYETSKKISKNENLKSLFFLTISFFSFFLIDYNINTGDAFSFRDLPILLSLIIFFKYLDNFNKNYFPLSILGFLSIVSFFWSIDRALIVNLLIIIFCLMILYNKNYFNFFIIFFSTIFSWIFFYLVLAEEYSYFIQNTFTVFKNINYIFGIIHPTPFSSMPDSSRATKSLLLIIISIIISLDFIFTKRKKYSNKFKIILISLSLVCFLSYIYALGRSDGGHIKQTTGMLYLFYSCFIFFNVINYLENKLLRKKINLYFFNISFVLLLILFIYLSNISFSNIYNYSKNLNKYIYYNDEVYLTEKQSRFIKDSNNFLSKYGCLQLFTYDAALPYLLKKSNCTKYYYIYSIGSFDIQNKMIDDMKDTQVIIYSGETDNWGVPPVEKLSLVNKFIKGTFPNNLKILDWDIRFK